MARTERQEDGTRGGVVTMTRAGTRSRPQQAPEAVPGTPDPRRGRQPRPVPRPRPGADQQVVQAQRPDRAARAAERRDQRVSSQGEAARGRGGRAVAAPARPGPRPRTGAPWRIPGRATGPKPAALQPPRTTGPQPAVVPPTRTTGPQPALSQSAAQSARPAIAGSNRMPFVLLLCGLLGGALISALVISTTLAAGSFQISKLQDSTASLAKQRQVLQEQVAQQQSAQTIGQEASQLGMRRNGELRYVDLKTGKTTNDGPTWSGAAKAPGYVP